MRFLGVTAGNGKALGLMKSGHIISSNKSETMVRSLNAMSVSIPPLKLSVV